MYQAYNDTFLLINFTLQRLQVLKQLLKKIKSHVGEEKKLPITKT